jgi:hypothetical protein
MKCYIDAKAGVDKEACAVCTVCGKGLCLEHANEVTKQMYREPSWVLHETVYILCDTCMAAIR